MHYKPTHAVQQEPIESAQNIVCFRLVWAGVDPSSRTITRTIFCCTITSHGEAKLVSVVSHRPVYHLLCNRWAAGSQRSTATLPSVGYFGWIVNDRCCVVDALSFWHPLGLRSFPRRAAHFRERRTTFPSDCLPDVRQQLADCVGVVGKCPSSVRESNAY